MRASISWQEWPIRAELKSCVRKIVTVEAPYGLPSESFNLIAPSPELKLVIPYRQTVSVHQCSASEQFSQGEGFVVGLQSQPSVVNCEKNYANVSVIFKPHSAYRFFPLPLDLLTGKMLRMDEIFGAASKEVSEKVAGKPAGAVVFHIQEFLRGRLTSCHEKWEAMVAETTRLCEDWSAARLAERWGYSARSLNNIFHRLTGVGPQELKRLVKFDKVYQLVNNGFLDAAQSHFYDQSHFIREFRSLIGQPPLAYLQKKNTVPNPFAFN